MLTVADTITTELTDKCRGPGGDWRAICALEEAFVCTVSDSSVSHTKI